ncbi:MAG: bifunctional 5,10-methylene-tetrahydrofolate dehydrogenase/5,10-methylene-tetrahydrofolate cyclohydrolase, partial [Ignavibacteria bacterium]|nr:bifunctional 5,10-methylene-tetrahydrofolate dehydrogenase/5,10-methylene-tetrahydrofolate cyclohydrolase [Ignavibacteria bacterium]
AISPDKDVDGFHPINFGKLLMGEETLRPCTPAGIQELLIHYQIHTEGKHVVVVGRSNIVGKPILAILIQKEKFANATVTLCHSATKNLKDYTLCADILISAMGNPGFIKAEMVNENSVIIDVGINRIDDSSSEKGYKIVGDVDFDEVSKKVKFITPVPGGVGPMTIAMLMKNTLIASAKFFNINLNN